MSNASRLTLIGRLCAQSSYDTAKITRHINRYSEGELAIREFGDELKAIGQTLARGFPAATMRMRSVSWLDSLEKRSNRLAFNIYINNIAAFGALTNLLKTRYDNLAVALIIDHPFFFYNDYCSFANNNNQLKWYRKSFFDRELYRIDKLLAPVERAVPKERLRIIASNNPAENEKAILDFFEVPWDEELNNILAPLSISGKRANRLLPATNNQFSLEEWRGMIADFEKGASAERLVKSEDARKLEEYIGKYWRFPRKKYPELENVLDQAAEKFLESPETEIKPIALGSLAERIPEAKKALILETNPVARRGLPVWQQGFFEILSGGKERDRAGVPKCCVLTFAYNQEKYIGECIESVAMQDLGSDMEHIIIDDASTDRTPEIIREYAKKYPRIKPVLFKYKPPNLIATGFNLCKSPYIALLDGDDYFTDKYKLRKQIDFLDANPDCAICFHYTEVFYEDGRPSQIYPNRAVMPDQSMRKLSLADLLQGNPMQTSSVMYRWRFAEGLPPWFRDDLVPGDWYWHLLHAENGKIGFLPEIMSRYRRHPNAGYASADGDTVAHRLKQGMRELETYQVADEYFRGKYHKDFQRLANGVFASYLQRYSDADDTSFLDIAASAFPVLAKGFLEELEKSSKESNKK